MLVISEGSGLVDSLINKLPIELHLPGYQYCGPGTKLQKRLERGDSGINPLDQACKDHDIAYSQSKDLKQRHEADRILVVSIC
ncbi:Phospholipase A2-like domain [Popillia japonica]|uniref:Phospholipase A2-like domain n=1 Tax=Popillia japonica TaxID=7064 RepID=A0AAW1HWH7_POPJA